MNENNRLAGVNLVTRDPQRLAAFYRDMLGARLVEDHGGPDRIEIWFGEPGEGNVYIAAHREEGYRPRPYQACQGFELRVEHADALCQALKARGVPIEEGPRDLPWGYRFFHIKDPDGNGIDLVQKL